MSMTTTAIRPTMLSTAIELPADETCRAEVQAIDLARSYLYGLDYAQHFAGRLDEHLRDTGITLPIRVGDRELVDDGAGGFLVRKIGGGQ